MKAAALLCGIECMGASGSGLIRLAQSALRACCAQSMQFSSMLHCGRGRVHLMLCLLALRPTLDVMMCRDDAAQAVSFMHDPSIVVLGMGKKAVCRCINSYRLSFHGLPVQVALLLVLALDLTRYNSKRWMSRMHVWRSGSCKPSGFRALVGQQRRFSPLCHVECLLRSPCSLLVGGRVWHAQVRHRLSGP